MNQSAYTELVISSRLPKDRCPGLLRPYLADDGAIMRLRKPGGHLSTATLVALAELVTRFGAAAIHLTSRGNIEARGLPVPLPDELVNEVLQLQLLPSVSHERVRNIFANPLAPQLAGLVAELDAAIMNDPALTELPGRFWFGFTDGTGLGLTEPLDIAYQQLNETEGQLIAAGKQARAVAPDQAVAAMIDLAHTFLATRPAVDAWNIRDLNPESQVFTGMHPISITPASPLVPGELGADLIAGIPLGDLTLDQCRILADLVPEIIVTPWRILVIPNGATQLNAVAEAGLIVTSSSPWGRVSACAGAPYCRNTTKPTLKIATDLVQIIEAEGPHIHLAGCERHCGASDNEHIIYPSNLQEALAQLTL